MMLIDDYLLEFDFNERHQAYIPAPPDAVRRALDEWRPTDSFLWRWLVRLRGLGSPQGTLQEWAEANGFLCLAETDDEVVYGQAGRFWAPNERAAMISPRTVEEFRSLTDARYAVAVMNILIEPLAPARTLLFTETRVRCLGASSRRRFRLYWLVIRPFSGLLRRAMLHAVKGEAVRNAEQASLTIGGPDGA
ncbi:MAG TPA: hypothetical protein VGR43_10015 [Dehalococcoidia bacterium]|nr:hypothetical protein [Dehalococcoidia bacterium]